MSSAVATLLVSLLPGIGATGCARTGDWWWGTHLKRARAKYAELGRPAGSRIDLYRAAVTDGILDT